MSRVTKKRKTAYHRRVHGTKKKLLQLWVTGVWTNRGHRRVCVSPPFKVHQHLATPRPPNDAGCSLLHKHKAFSISSEGGIHRNLDDLWLMWSILMLTLSTYLRLINIILVNPWNIWTRVISVCLWNLHLAVYLYPWSFHTVCLLHMFWTQPGVKYC